MRIFRLLTVGIAAAAFAACSSPETNTANTTAQNTANTTNQAAPQQQQAQPALSPSDTLKALSEASKKRDPQEIKRYLSTGTIARLDMAANEQKKTTDELLAEDDGAPFPQMPQLGKEEIQGDMATVEVLNSETKQFEKMPFVKEDGQWKVAIDVYLDNLDAAMEEAEREADQKPNKRGK